MVQSLERRVIRHHKHGKVFDVRAEHSDGHIGWVRYLEDRTEHYSMADGWQDITDEQNITEQCIINEQIRAHSCLCLPIKQCFPLYQGLEWRQSHAVVLPNGETWETYWDKLAEAYPSHDVAGCLEQSATVVLEIWSVA